MLNRTRRKGGAAMLAVAGAVGAAGRAAASGELNTARATSARATGADEQGQRPEPGAERGG